MDRRRVGLVAVALGVLVVANPLYLGVWTAVGNVYAESVAPVALGVEADEGPEGVPVVRYEALSPHARLVVGRAIERGHYTVLGASNRPSRFSYYSGFDARPDEHLVVRDGTTYRIRTSGATFGAAFLVVQLALVGLGAYAAVAGDRARRGDSTAAVPLVVGAVGLALVALGPPLGFPGTTATGWGLVVLAAALLVAVRAGVVRAARRVRG